MEITLQHRHETDKRKVFATARSRLILMSFVLTLIAGCASLPPNVDRDISHAVEGTEDTQLGRLVTSGQVADGESGVWALPSGLDAFVARAALASMAERTLDVQYYLYHRDLVGRLLLMELLEAAERGVRVRLLIDDMDTAGSDEVIAVIDAQPNIQVRLFNPFARNVTRAGQMLGRFGTVTRRMHNKTFTADNQMTIVGGRNIGNEYFEADAALAFADMDVLLAGPAAQEVSSSFDLYWNSELAYPIGSLGEQAPSAQAIQSGLSRMEQFSAEHETSMYVEALSNTDLQKTFLADSFAMQWSPVHIYYDDPAKLTNDRARGDLHLAPQLRSYLDQVTDELMIVSPYFVPGKKATGTLCKLVDRGVEVTVVTNSLASTDVAVVHSGYLRYRKNLLRCGVQLWEINSDATLTKESASDQEQPGDMKARTSLHAKMFVFDRRYSFVGSLNIDPRSITENTEIGAVIDQPAFAEMALQSFASRLPVVAFRLSIEQDKVIWTGTENGKSVRYTTEPHTSFMQRAAANLMRFLPIESQI